MTPSGNPGPPIERSLPSRLCWFAVAGLGGFLVDAGVLTLLVHLGLDARVARLASFACALTMTWLINRSRTFGDRVAQPSLREFLRYASASTLAALINLGIFTVLFTLGGPFAQWPVLAVAVATGVSMSVNFLSYLKLVFARKN